MHEGKDRFRAEGVVPGVEPVQDHPCCGTKTMPMPTPMSTRRVVAAVTELKGEQSDPQPR